MGRSAWLRVRSDPPTAVQMDGEVLSTEAKVVEYRVLPHRLEVIV
jgi:diacylglycerol kinase family enzyme